MNDDSDDDLNINDDGSAKIYGRDEQARRMNFDPKNIVAHNENHKKKKTRRKSQKERTTTTTTTDVVTMVDVEQTKELLNLSGEQQVMDDHVAIKNTSQQFKDRNSWLKEIPRTSTDDVVAANSNETFQEARTNYIKILEEFDCAQTPYVEVMKVDQGGEKKEKEVQSPESEAIAECYKTRFIHSKNKRENKRNQTDNEEAMELVKKCSQAILSSKQRGDDELDDILSEKTRRKFAESILNKQAFPIGTVEQETKTNGELGEFDNNPQVVHHRRFVDDIYLRPPADDVERECANGKKCEGLNIDEVDGFILVEFPNDQTRAYYERQYRKKGMDANNSNNMRTTSSSLQKSGNAASSTHIRKKMRSTSSMKNTFDDEPPRTLCVLCERAHNMLMYIQCKSESASSCQGDANRSVHDKYENFAVFTPTYSVSLEEYSMRDLLGTTSLPNATWGFMIINHANTKYSVVKKEHRFEDEQGRFFITKKHYLQKYTVPSYSP